MAVKLFKLDLPPERGHQLLAEFERLIAANLTHPALAAPLAAGISDVSTFLVQDYVAADSLDLAVREYGPAPTADALRVVTQLAAALDLAAAVDITHGALHPRDVLLSTDDTRLTGLGVTRALERIGIVAPVRRPYTAPERIAGGAWDRRADVFSLAALIHELIWGRRISGIGAQAAESLTEIAGADLDALRATFARALAENPAERYDTATHFAEALTIACPGVVVAPALAKPAKRRREVRDVEPKLPLDEDAVVPAAPVAEVAAVAEVAQDLGPADLSLAAPDAAPDPRFQHIDDAAVTDEPVITRDVAPELVRHLEPDVAPYEPSMAIPAGLITGHDEPLSALEVSRTAIWPLALALGVGMAVGFGGGFFVGSREQPTPVAAATSVTSTAPASPGKEFTESAVAAPAPAAAPNLELRTQNSEPKNLKSPAADGRLMVRTRPAGARVSVDGREHGRTPVTVRDLARGAHRVTITRDGYAPEERRIVITASRVSQAIMVPLAKQRVAGRTAPAPAAPAARSTGAVAFESRPAGAMVYMDGKLVGTTPTLLAAVQAGTHAVRLEHDGYRSWSASVRVVAGEPNRVTASLER